MATASADTKQVMDASIKFEWKFGTDHMTLRVPKGRTVTKLKSDIASYLQIAVSRLQLYQDDKELTDAKQKVDTLDPTRPIHVHERTK